MNKFDKDKFEENRKIIAPITFVGDSVKKDEELNSLFTLPYDLSILSRATTNTLAFNVTKSGTFDKDALIEYNNFSHDIARMNKENHIEAIRSYLIMNCRDFVLTFLMKIFREIINDTIVESYRIKKHDQDDYENEYDDDKYFFTYFGYFRKNDVDNIIKNCIDDSNLVLYFQSILPSIYYYQLMNKLYFKLIVYIDNVIIDMADRRFQNNRTMNKLIENVYGPNNGIDVTKFTAEFRYTFTTSILREKVEKKLPDLYYGLHQIFNVAASMAFVGNNPAYIDDMKSAGFGFIELDDSIISKK